MPFHANLFNKAKSAAEEARLAFQKLQPFVKASPWDELKQKAQTFLPQFQQPIAPQIRQSSQQVWNTLRTKVEQTLPNIQQTFQTVRKNIADFPIIKSQTPFEIVKTPTVTLGQAGEFIASRLKQSAANQQRFNQLLNEAKRRQLTPEEKQFVENGIATFAPTGGIKTVGKQIVKPLVSKVAEEAGQVLRKGGKNLFTNVPTIDNPLLLGKDWQKASQVLKQRMENLKPSPQNFSKPDFLNEIARIEKATEPKIQTPVTKKVNLLDYFRTPDRVLTKIGLGNETRFLRSQYEQYIQQLPKEIDRITQWVKQVPQESSRAIFRYLDGQGQKLNPTEQKVANEIREYLKNWADKLGLPEDKRVASYITHLFESDFIKKEFDEDLARLIRDKVPGSVYNPFLQQRLGKLGYKEDVWQALDAYVKRATRQFYMNPALEKIKQKSVNFEETQYDYVKKFTDNVNFRPSKLDNLIDNLVKSSPIGYRFGQRPITFLTKVGRQMVYRGTLGLNITTAIKNLTQGANTYAKLGEKYTILGYLRLLKNWGSDELNRVGVLADNFIQDRQLSAGKQLLQRFDTALWKLFDTAEKINRGAAYYGAKAKALEMGKSEQEAIEFAKKIVRDTNFVFGSVDTPVALQSDIAKTLAQFQSFTIKQAEFLGEMIKAKDYAGLIRWLGASLGIVSLIGDTIGIEPKDLVPGMGILSGQTRLGETPTIAAIRQGAQFTFGDEEKREEALRELGRTARTFIPGGVQLFKTGEALQAMQEGASFTPSGKLRFEVKPSLKTAIFGIWRTKEAQDYLKEKQQLDLSQEEKDAKAFKEQEKKVETQESKLAAKMFLELKKLAPDEQMDVLDAWDSEGRLTDELIDKLEAFKKQEEQKDEPRFVKAVRMAANTNTGKAKFLNLFLKNKTPQERLELLEQLDNAGVLTDDLLKKIEETSGN